MLSVDNEEATLGSELSERRLGPLEEGTVPNGDLNFQAALRTLMQQQANGGNTVEEAVALAASSSSGASQRSRISPLNLFLQQHQDRVRGSPRRKVSEIDQTFHPTGVLPNQ